LLPPTAVAEQTMNNPDNPVGSPAIASWLESSSEQDWTSMGLAKSNWGLGIQCGNRQFHI
jgi:hypothetical protein